MEIFEYYMLFSTITIFVLILDIFLYFKLEPEGEDVIEHIIRLRKKFGWQTILPKSKFDIKQCKLLVQQAIQEVFFSVFTFKINI